MNILIDTCAFVWVLQEPERLSAGAKDVFQSRGTTAYLSAVSVWELAVKYRLGKIKLPDVPAAFVPEAMRRLNLEPLDLDVEAAVLAAELDDHHGDPFDRMLVCQALHHGLTILTPDRLIRRYGVSCVW